MMSKMIHKILSFKRPLMWTGCLLFCSALAFWSAGCSKSKDGGKNDGRCHLDEGYYQNPNSERYPLLNVYKADGKLQVDLTNKEVGEVYSNKNIEVGLNPTCTHISSHINYTLINQYNYSYEQDGDSIVIKEEYSLHGENETDVIAKSSTNHRVQKTTQSIYLENLDYVLKKSKRSNQIPNEDLSPTSPVVPTSPKKTPSITKLSDEQIKKIAEKEYDSLLNSNELKIDMSELADAIRKDNNPSWGATNKEAFIAEAIPKVISEYSFGIRSQYIEGIGKLISSIQSCAEQMTDIEKFPAASKALDYYKQQYGITIGGVKIIGCHLNWLNGFVSNVDVNEALALYVAWPLVSEFPLDVTFEFNKFPKTYKGTIKQYTFNKYRARLLNGHRFIEQTVAGVFGSSHLVVVKEELMKKEDPALPSVLIHELRHHLDYRDNPVWYSDADRILKEHNQLIDLQRERVNSDYVPVCKSQAYELFLDDYASKMRELGSLTSTAELKKSAENVYNKFWNNMYRRYVYYNSETEKRAFQEIARYYRLIENKTEAEVLFMLDAGAYYTYKIVDYSGNKKFDISIPAAPYYHDYGKELYQNALNLVPSSSFKGK